MILVLVTTCSIFFARTGLVSSNPGDPAVGGGGYSLSQTGTPEISIPVEPTSTPNGGVCITVVAPSPTVTSTLKPTATKVPATATVKPTATATLKPTSTKVSPTATAVPMPFKKQDGSPQFIRGFAHLSAGCNWQGYAGQVFDKNGKPLNDYIVKITGSYNGNSVSLLGVTGAVSGDPYGPGGYEIVLGDSIHQSFGTLFIQLFNSKGTAVSDSYAVNTSTYCSKNLGIFNFTQK